MKHLSLISVLASLVAAVALPLPLELVAYFAFVAGIGCIWAQDYSGRRPLRFQTDPAARVKLISPVSLRPRHTFRAPALASESHRLAA